MVLFKRTTSRILLVSGRPSWGEKWWRQDICLHNLLKRWARRSTVCTVAWSKKRFWKVLILKLNNYKLRVHSSLPLINCSWSLNQKFNRQRLMLSCRCCTMLNNLKTVNLSSKTSSSSWLKTYWTNCKKFVFHKILRLLTVMIVTASPSFNRKICLMKRVRMDHLKS